jgi:demethoxyubiquinone hydroxylase (CLK1/Coq7/Cat5 family)
VPGVREPPPVGRACAGGRRRNFRARAASLSDMTPIDPPTPTPTHDPGVRPQGANLVPATGAGTPALTVYFDGACPVCSREIATYRRLRGGASIDWVDASRCTPEALGPGLDRGAALARLHARGADGTLVDGAAAFAAVWRRLPAFSLLGRIAGFAPVRAVLDVGYAGFLRVRRAWRAPASDWSPEIEGDLRTDHAGETGAISIYRGILAVTRDAGLRAFAARHLETESAHLERIEAVLPASARSRLLPAWRLAGWLTGALPALAGPRAVHATIRAVETFVDLHYREQLERIDALDPQRADARLQGLRTMLDGCREDEVAHRDEAAAALAADPRPAGAVIRAWTAIVGSGSAAAVTVCRRI